MNQTITLSKLIPVIVLLAMTLFFIGSFLRGSLLVQKSEKEMNPKKQIEEAQAKSYSLKEIDAKTGQVRWQLTAKEGMTENNLQAALIKDIKAEVYKDSEVVFELEAPQAIANASTKEIYLAGDVTCKDKSGNFLLESNQLALGMGTSIEAQKGFRLTLKNSGYITGDNALINDSQTKITVKKLKEASFKDVLITGELVDIDRDIKGDLTKVVISDSGKIVLKKLNNNTLAANIIKWDKTGEIEAISEVVYIQEDKTFKANYLLLKPSGKVYAKNNVLITHGATQCYGNSLTYENNSLTLTGGHPRAIQSGKEITADKISYDLKTGKVEAVGNVKITVINKA